MIHVLTLSVLCLAPTTQMSPSAAIQLANGLAIARFHVQGGTIAVTLPSGFQAGDQISGLVIAEPSGKTSAEQKSNSATLEGYVVEFAGGTAAPKKGRLTSTISAAALAAGLPLVLKDAAGHVVGETQFGGFGPEPFRPQPAPPNVQTPPSQAPLDQTVPEPYRRHPLPPPTFSGQRVPDPNDPEPFRTGPVAQAGRPISITGPFDGDASNTKVSVGGQAGVILAETPRGAVVQPLPTKPGSTTVEVQEGSKTQTLKTNTLKVSLAIDKSTLVRGEQAQAHVTVEGLEGMPKQAFPLMLQLTNLARGVVTLSGGDKQTTKIDACSSFSMPLQVTATQPGGFALQADIEGNYNPYPWGYNDDQDHPIDMNGIDTIGDLENYSTRRLMDTLRDLRARKLYSYSQGNTDTDWLDKKIRLVKAALKQRGVDVAHTLVDPE